jgi:hypothetical protein
LLFQRHAVLLKVLLIDVDSVFEQSSKPQLMLPICSQEICDRPEGNYRSPDGQCSRKQWCPHARRSPEQIKAYTDPCHLRGKSSYAAVIPALERIIKEGWQVCFWSTRPKNQQFEIIQVLRRCGVWDLALLTHHGQNPELLLHTIRIPENWDFSIETAKLMILETKYGKLLDDHDTQIVAIERDPLEAAILRSYSKRIIVKTSPDVWISILTSPSEVITQSLIEETIPR